MSYTPTVKFQIISLFGFSLFFFSFHSSFSLSPNFRTVSQYHRDYNISMFNTRHSLQNVVFPEFYFNSEVFFPFHFSPCLFAISFQAACFSCFFSLAPVSALWRPLIVGTQYYSSGCRPLLPPLAANFLYCQSNLTFPSTLYFPKFQFTITLSRLPIIYPQPRDLFYLSVTFHFQFFQILIFRGAYTNTSVPHAAVLSSRWIIILFN